ncbi:hypothetical protein M9458_056708 [Cirrhinus mrigala]|uniref:ribonuclease H n=1 Tax=Cirrhinus mrigala TaxID=683832 RepID=A0ABD0MH66_CIRMR
MLLDYEPSSAKIDPLASRLKAWAAIPGVLPGFSGVVQTSVQDNKALVLQQECHPANSKSGFFSLYFLVPKKDVGLRPILDLRRLHHLLMQLVNIQDVDHQTDSRAYLPRDWFLTVDIKDAYFHIPIAHHQRPFLRFAFEGVVYQYTVLPFGLSLAPFTFTKCIDAPLSPLRQMGIQILNYLDDRIVLAKSERELVAHKELLLSHLDCLGLIINPHKSQLLPRQRVVFLGTILDSTQIRAWINAGMIPDDSVIGGFSQTRDQTPLEGFSEDARPNSGHLFYNTYGPATHAAPPILT